MLSLAKFNPLTYDPLTYLDKSCFLLYFQSLTIFFEKSCEKGGTFLHFLVICI